MIVDDNSSVIYYKLSYQEQTYKWLALWILFLTYTFL